MAGELELGKLRDYAIDLVPKFIMAGGQLVKVQCAQLAQLHHSGCSLTNSLEH